METDIFILIGINIDEVSGRVEQCCDQIIAFTRLVCLICDCYMDIVVITTGTVDLICRFTGNALDLCSPVCRIDGELYITD